MLAAGAARAQAPPGQERFDSTTKDEPLDCRHAREDEVKRWNFEHGMYLKQAETLREELNQKLAACPPPPDARQASRCRDEAYAAYHREKRELERADDEGLAAHNAKLRAIEGRCAGTTGGRPRPSSGRGSGPGRAPAPTTPAPTTPAPTTPAPTTPAPAPGPPESQPPVTHRPAPATRSPRPDAGTGTNATPKALLCQTTLPDGRESWRVNPSLPCAAVPVVGGAVRGQQDLARLVFERYNTQRPVGVYRVTSLEDTCLMVLSGTEPFNLMQATTLPEDVNAALGLDDAFRQAVFANLRTPGVRDQCPPGTRWVIAGHSLGGMEGQHIAMDPRFAALHYTASHVITFGSPRVNEEAPGIAYRRFSSIGDPIPEVTRPLYAYKSARQLYVDDRCTQDRGRALVEERERLQQALQPLSLDPMQPPALVITRQLAALLPGALGEHMAYPCVKDLARYDALGLMGGRATLELDRAHAQFIAAPRPLGGAPAY